MVEKIANNKSETGDTIWVKGCFIVSHLRFHYIPARRAGTSLCVRSGHQVNETKYFTLVKVLIGGKAHIQSDLKVTSFPLGYGCFSAACTLVLRGSGGC